MSFFTNQKVLPFIMVVLNILAAANYACHKDWRHTVYWAASAVLIAAVTF